jgi:hypothetical protein
VAGEKINADKHLSCSLDVAVEAGGYGKSRA